MRKKPVPQLAPTIVDRRKGGSVDRREGEDRRDFPRPEGRRTSGGRRLTDPKEI